jgi:hypothetical protein
MVKEDLEFQLLDVATEEGIAAAKLNGMCAVAIRNTRSHRKTRCFCRKSSKSRLFIYFMWWRS